MPGFFDHLEDDNFAKASVKETTPEQMRERASIVNGGETGYEQIKCVKCGGRGSRTYGYVNIRSYPCGICKGTGKVTARRLANVERFKKAEATREHNARIARMSFQEENDKLLRFLSNASEWSSFAASLMESFSQRGNLSEKQLAAGQSMMDKAEARKIEKAAEAQNGPKLDVSAIEKLFATASASGLKRPVFRAADGIAVSLAPATGRNAGALYVKENDEYAGKIVNGVYQATRTASEAVLPRLMAIAVDPLGEATLYGKQTGTCGCCGRELTDPSSIEAGIGPICAGKWGL